MAEIDKNITVSKKFHKVSPVLKSSARKRNPINDDLSVFLNEKTSIYISTRLHTGFTGQMSQNAARCNEISGFLKAGNV